MRRDREGKDPVWRNNASALVQGGNSRSVTRPHVERGKRTFRGEREKGTYHHSRSKKAYGPSDPPNIRRKTGGEPH